MGDPGRNTGMADILRKKITDLAVDLQEKERENNQLRAELAAAREKVSALEIKVNNQQDWLVEWRKCEEALKAEKEGNKRLTLELTTCKSFHDVAVKERDAERREVDKLRTELAAERKKREEAEEQVELDTKMMDYRDKQIVNLEAQVEVLRRSLENISNLKIDPTSPEIFYHHVTDLTSRALANLPARSAAIRKVLEAAEEYVVSCQEEAMGPRFLEETNLFEAVREAKRLASENPGKEFFVLRAISSVKYLEEPLKWRHFAKK
jgi:myosin heavy subunit